MRLSCDQRSNALSTWFSATEGSLGRVLVRMLSQWPRMDCSRASKSAPWLTDLRKSAMRAARSFQLRVNGERINLSPAQMAMAAMATAVSNCWRWLMFIAPLLAPMEVEGELQRRFAANLIDLHVRDLLGGAQLIERFQQRLAVARGPGARYRRQIANLDGLGEHDSIGGKGLSDPAQNAQGAQRIVKPRPEFSDLLLQIVQLADRWRHDGPFGSQARKLPLLAQKQRGDQNRDRRGSRPRPYQLAGGIPRRELPPRFDFRREKLQPQAAPNQMPRGQAERRGNRRVGGKLDAEVGSGVTGQQRHRQSHRFEPGPQFLGQLLGEVSLAEHLYPARRAAQLAGQLSERDPDFSRDHVGLQPLFPTFRFQRSLQHSQGGHAASAGDLQADAVPANDQGQHCLGRFL